MELQSSLVNPVLDNIPETPTRISTMILGVVILTIYFSFKIFFGEELEILRKSEELLIHKEIFLSLTSDVYWTCAFDACDLFPRSHVFSTNKGKVNEPILGRFFTT